MLLLLSLSLSLSICLHRFTTFAPWTRHSRSSARTGPSSTSASSSAAGGTMSIAHLRKTITISTTWLASRLPPNSQPLEIPSIFHRLLLTGQQRRLNLSSSSSSSQSSPAPLACRKNRWNKFMGPHLLRQSFSPFWSRRQSDVRQVDWKLRRFNRRPRPPTKKTRRRRIENYTTITIIYYSR